MNDDVQISYFFFLCHALFVCDFYISIRSLEVTNENSNFSCFIIALPGLTYSTVSLLSTVVFLVLATHLNGWKLDRRYGVILMIWYLVFIVFASLYELNVFGEMNPPVCFSAF